MFMKKYLCKGETNLNLNSSVDLRYETKDVSRDFHAKRRAFVIYENKLYFIEKGSSMSHYEFCSSKLNLTKEEFNELTRGYYLDGNLVFYKDNFYYDEKVVNEGLLYVNQIKKTLKITDANIYFGLIVGNPGESWPFDYFYGVSLANDEIIKNS